MIAPGLVYARLRRVSQPLQAAQWRQPLANRTGWFREEFVGELLKESGLTRASLVLAADNGPSLAAFYGTLLGCQSEVGVSGSHWQLAMPGGGLMEIYVPSQARPLPRQIGRMALCLQRDAAGEVPLVRLQGWIDLALAAGARQDQPPRLEAFGAEAWLLDPEANRLLLLVPAALVD